MSATNGTAAQQQQQPNTPTTSVTKPESVPALDDEFEDFPHEGEAILPILDRRTDSGIV